jgi:hypothetical protein
MLMPGSQAGKILHLIRDEIARWGQILALETKNGCLVSKRRGLHYGFVASESLIHTLSVAVLALT